MKNIFFIIVFTCLFSCKSKKEIAKTKQKQIDLIGVINKSYFLQNPHKVWFTKNYNLYTPDSITINILKEKLKLKVLLEHGVEIVKEKYLIFIKF